MEQSKKWFGLKKRWVVVTLLVVAVIFSTVAIINSYSAYNPAGTYDVSGIVGGDTETCTVNGITVSSKYTNAPAKIRMLIDVSEDGTITSLVTGGEARVLRQHNLKCNHENCTSWGSFDVESLTLNFAIVFARRGKASLFIPSIDELPPNSKIVKIGFISLDITSENGTVCHTLPADLDNGYIGVALGKKI